MNPTFDQEEALAKAPFDAEDATVLASVHDLFDALDPMPGDLIDRIKFAMSVASLEAEVAQIVSESSLALTHRTDYTRAQTVTFASDHLNLMVTIEDHSPSLVDVIGWVSEPHVEVELRERGRTRTTTVDSEGRFVFAGIARGLVNFVLRRLEESESPPIITPAIEL